MLMRSSSRPRRSKARPGRATSSAARSPEGVALHTLQNTLASLKLRLAVLAADPTCRWAQGENVLTLVRLMDLSIEQSGRLRQRLEASAARKKRSRSPG
jgi:hypothetical protein